MKKFYHLVLLIAYLFCLDGEASADSEICGKGEFWSPKHQLCLHNYYHSCSNHKRIDDRHSNEARIFKYLSRLIPQDKYTHIYPCVNISANLSKIRYLYIDCDGISDLSALYPLPTVEHVVLTNMMSLRSIDFLDNSSLVVLSMENFDINLDISVIGRLGNTLRSLGLNSGDTFQAPTMISNLDYLEMGDFKPGKKWADFLKNKNIVKTMLCRYERRCEWHNGSGTEYKVTSVIAEY